MCGVLDASERLVDLEGLAEMLGGLRVQSVVAEAANEGQNGVSRAANRRNQGVRRRT